MFWSQGKQLHIAWNNIHCFIFPVQELISLSNYVILFATESTEFLRAFRQTGQTPSMLTGLLMFISLLMCSVSIFQYTKNNFAVGVAEYVHKLFSDTLFSFFFVACCFDRFVLFHLCFLSYISMFQGSAVLSITICTSLRFLFP